MAEKRVETLNWPPNSPDLNPIENLWGILKVAVSKRFPTTKEQLVEAISLEWENLSSETVQNLILSMPKRIKEVLKNKGQKCNY